MTSRCVLSSFIPKDLKSENTPGNNTGSPIVSTIGQRAKKDKRLRDGWLNRVALKTGLGYGESEYMKHRQYMQRRPAPDPARGKKELLDLLSMLIPGVDIQAVLDAVEKRQFEGAKFVAVAMAAAALMSTGGKSPDEAIDLALVELEARLASIKEVKT
jgi:hypothetical protein